MFEFEKGNLWETNFLWNDFGRKQVVGFTVNFSNKKQKYLIGWIELQFTVHL